METGPKYLPGIRVTGGGGRLEDLLAVNREGVINVIEIK
jgi:hypothetical protein